MRKVSDEFVEKIKTHFMDNDVFFNCVFYEIMWKNIIEPKRQQMIIWRMRTYQSLQTHFSTANWSQEYAALLLFENVWKIMRIWKTATVNLSLRHTTETEYGVLSVYAHSYFVIIQMKKKYSKPITLSTVIMPTSLVYPQAKSPKLRDRFRLNSV